VRADGSGVFAILRAESRADHQLGKMLENIFTSAALSAPPGSNRWQLQVFTENVPAQSWQERHEGRALHQTAAQTIGNRDISGPQCAHQPSDAEHRIIAQLQRITPIVVDATKDHVDRLKAGQGLEKHPVVPDRQILSFHERVTQITRKPNLLAIGLVERPWS